MDLAARTIRGVGWSGISQAVRLLSHFVIIAILCRLLSPDDFGLLAMVLVFTNFTMIFCDLGLKAALIQRKELTEEHLSSIFWINVLTGFLLASLLVILAPAISNFYDKSILRSIVTALALTFFISSFGIVHSALFAKKLNFKSLAVVKISAVLISGIVAIILAFLGFGIWSLVWQQIVLSLATVILLWNLSHWKPKFLFKWQRVKKLFGFGLNLTGFNFVNYFNRNFDNLIVGKFLGSIPLGFYNLAYQTLLFPLTNISQVVGQVMFPNFSIIQSDKDKLRYSYIKTTRYIAAVTFPLMIALLVTAPQFIRVIFGSQWERSIFLIQAFTITGLIQSIGTLNGTIYQSQGRTDIQFRVGIIFAVITAFFFIVGLRWNIEGVAVAYVIVGLLLMYPSFAIPFKLINLKFSYFAKQFKLIFLAAAGMGGVIFMTSIFMENVLKMGDLIILISVVAVGAISYISFLFMLDKCLCCGIFRFFKQLKSSL